MKRRILAAILLALPLLLGAITASAANLDIASSWNDSEEEQGAPAAVADQEAIRSAHQAASQAVSQSSFLLMGTQQLVEGVGQLVAGADQLADGTSTAAEAAAALSQGMVQLQAGTDQLGSGATQLADAIDEAAAAGAGVEAVRGQIVQAIDDALADLRKNDDAESQEMISALQDLRQQAATYSLDEDILSDLREAQQGARQLANQLAVSGYAYHDGIYEATQGAQQLASGLAELDAGVGQAVDGINELEDGATQVDDMANTTSNRIKEVQRSLPTVSTATEGEAPSQLLSPLYAFFIAGFVMFAATTWRRGSWILSVISLLAIAILAAGLVAIVGTNISAASAVVVGVIAAIALVAAAAATTAAMGIFGTVAGGAIALVLLALQAAFVGWVWNEAATQTVSNGMEFLVRLFPLHYATAAISTVGNGIWSTGLWISVGVLVAFAVVAVLSTRFILPRAQQGRHRTAEAAL